MLKDCTPIDIKAFAKKYFGGTNTKSIALAIGWLQDLYAYSMEDSDLLRFSNKLLESEPIVYREASGVWWVGRYIGTIFFKDKSVDIAPRTDFSFIIDNFPMNNFIPIDSDTLPDSGKEFLNLILAIQWINLLVKATKHALPVVKKQKVHCKSVITGRLDVRSTLKQRLKDDSKVVSVSLIKDINNPITEVIVLAYQEIQNWFPNHDLKHWMPEVTALRLQQMIDTTSRHTRAPKHQQIKSAKLMPIAKGYLPVAWLSKDVIDHKGTSQKQSHSTNKTMLLDIAELWEAYVFKVLQQASPSEITVQNGTFSSSDFLLLSGNKKLGKLIPDYLLLHDESPLFVADAKYKRIGDAPWMSPKRDDLYQMTAYINHFQGVKHGVLFYPQWGEETESNNCKILNDNPWKFSDGKLLSFISLPTKLNEAVALLKGKLDISHQ